jgi:DNA-binding winged helix-turn-helix (wHTH) protein/tetratricopeptide (TPR) repeat protein/type II secretory pathway predicted ATPase ExeA
MFRFGEFLFDRRRGGLFRIGGDGAPLAVPLGSRAVDLLAVLLEHHGDIVSKTDIIAMVWPGLVVEEANLAVQIHAVRHALEQTRGNGWIQTIPGRGYRFTGAVSRLPADPPVAGVYTDVATTNSTAVGTIAPPRVGRADALRTLAASLKRALDGHRQMVFVTGEAGIGKTTLLDMALTQIPHGDIGILRGHCTDLLGTSEAFLPLIEALQTACHGTHGALLLKTMREHAPTWLAQMPGFLDANDRATFQSEIFGATRERMLREFCEFMEAASAVRPWILVLEDLHWSDGATLDALSRFARRDRRAATQIMATYRPEDVRMERHPVLTVHRDLRTRGYCQEIELTRLDRTDVQHYLALRFGGRGPTDAMCEWVFARTKGHPLFVVSFVDDFVARGVITQRDGQWQLDNTAALSQDIPRDARDMLTRQIDRLDIHVQGLLEVASAAGAEFSAALVARATGADVLSAEQSFELLDRNGLILTGTGRADWPDGSSAGRYAFLHALYQDVLYERLAPGRLVAIHRRLGECLEAGYQARSPEIAPLLARHFEAGRDTAKAIKYLTHAAENSAQRFATQEAAQYLSRALRLVDGLPGADRLSTHIALLRQRGWTRRSAGDFAGAQEDVRTMIAVAADSGQRRMEVTGLMDLCRFSLFTDRQQCLPVAERARMLTGTLDDAPLAALVNGAVASINLYLRGWRDEDAALCRQAIRLTADASDPATTMRTAAIQGAVAVVTADYPTCGAASARGKEMARRAGDVFMFALHNVQGSFALTHLGALGEVRRQTAAALAITERNGNQTASTLCRLTLGWLHAEAQDFPGAVRWCETNHDPALEANPFIYHWRRMVLAKARLGLGDYPAAWDCLAAVGAKTDADHDILDYALRVELYHCLGEYWIATDGLQQARTQAQRLLAATAGAPDRNYLALAHRLLASIAMAENNRQEARAQIDRAVSMLENAQLPMTARRIYRTAAAFHDSVGEAEIAAGYRDRLAKIVLTLVTTLDPPDPLRSSLLAGTALVRA